MNVLEARRRLLGAGVYKKTVTGNPAIAQGSLARMYPGITMQGWTEQASTTGAQLLDLSNTADRTDTTYVLTDTGLTVTGLFYVTTLVDINPNTDMYISYEKSGDGVNIVSIYNSSGLTSDDRIATYSTQGGTFNTGDNSQINVLFYSGQGTSSSSTYSNVMLNEGTSAKPYEPYTGGAPSPSPDYPQEIVSAGEYDEASGKYKVDVTLGGSNLFDISNIKTYEGGNIIEKSEGYTVDGNDIVVINNVRNQIPGINIPVDASQENIFVAYTTNSAIKSIYFLFIYTDGTKSVQDSYSGNSHVIPLVPDEGKTIQSVNLGIGDYNGDVSYTLSEIMVNYGTTPLPWEPYKPPQTVTLTSDRPLTKWDKLTKKDGQWGWEYKSAEIVLDGSEDESWMYFASLSTSESSVFYITIPGLVEKQHSYNTEFGFIDNREKEGFMHAGTESSYFLSILASRINTQDAAGLKKWLSENPMTVIYKTTEETFTPLSASEQEQMNALHTNRPTTVLSNDADCEMTLTYKTKKSLWGGYNPYRLEIGGLSGSGTGNEADLTNRIRTGYIPFSSDDGTKKYVIDGYAPYSVVNNTAYDSGKNAISTYTQSMPPAGTSYVRISFRKSDDSDFTEAELDTMIKTFTFEEVTT